MNKIKLLSIAVIVLILINIATLTFFFIKGPRPMPKNDPKEIVVKKLNFNENQIVAYDELIKVHSKEIMVLNDAILRTKNNLYSELSRSDNKKVTDSLFSILASLQNKIEITHYNHFLDIKKLCKPEQIEDFNALSHELSQIFSPKLPPKHRSRENHP